MKNIHVLPTDKPSRLYLWTDENGTRPALCELEYSHTRNTQNIYITNSEEIKEGDWFLNTRSNAIGQHNGSRILLFKEDKKIILTTDQDLIKDGVQKIDNEFLEWFVKNPSCDEIKVEGHIYKGQDETEYKIIIPKEEPKQDFILVKEDCTCIDECMYYLSKQCKHLKEEPKKETLEEATKNFLNTKQEFYFKKDSLLWKFLIKISQFGAKWQQEQDKNKYSEEEVMDMFHNLSMHLPLHYEFLVKEQFKKK